MSTTPAAPLSADALNAIAQASGYKGPAFSSVGLLNSSNLKSSPTIQVPNAPQTNYQGAVANGNATMGANNPHLSQPPAGWDPVTYASFKAANPTLEPTPEDTRKMQGTTNTDPMQALFDKYMGNQEAAPSATNQYNQDYANSGVSDAQTKYNTDQQSVKNAQADLASVTAKIQGINAEGEAMNLKQDSRFAPMSAIQGQQAQNNRETAIRALPLQVEALAAQAKVAAAQGNAQLSQGILTQAQDHLDTIFKLHQEDATNQYKAKQDIRDKVYQFASDQEKTKLDAQKTTDAQNFALLQNNLNNAQSLAAKAIESGQASLAAKLTALDPHSPTYQKDIAAYAAKIVPKASTTGGTETERADAAVADLHAQIASGTPLADGTPVVDPNGFMTPVAWNKLITHAPKEKLNREKFIKEFGYLVYQDPKDGIPSSYKITPAEQKLINGS